VPVHSAMSNLSIFKHKLKRFWRRAGPSLGTVQKLFPIFTERKTGVKDTLLTTDFCAITVRVMRALEREYNLCQFL
jgi:hypothetical protein